jgi:hypothetical protein
MTIFNFCCNSASSPQGATNKRRVDWHLLLIADGDDEVPGGGKRNLCDANN